MCRRFLLQILMALILCVPALAQKAEQPQPAAQPPAAVKQPAIAEGGRVENPPEKLNLAYKFQEGQSNRYQVQMMNQGNYRLLNQKKEVELSTVTEMFFRQRVKGEEDGLFKVEWAMLSGTVRIPGFGESVITVPEMTYTMDERGGVKKISGLEKMAALPGKPQQKTLAALLAQLRFQGFPREAVKMGDEWSREYPLESPEGDKLTVRTTSKLLDYEKCDGYDCAKIRTKYDYPIKLVVDDKDHGKLRLEGKESGEIVTHFAFKEGKMVRSEGDITADAKVAKSDGTLGDAFVKLQINAVSRLLPPSEADKEAK